MNLFEKIDRWSKLAPDRLAHISGGEKLSYRRLTEDSDSLAAYLAAFLPDDQSPVAVVGHKEPEMIIAFLAAVKAGHPYIPVDTSLPSSRGKIIMETSGASLSLTPAEIKILLQGLRGKPTQLPERKTLSNTAWYILFTSGSTGEPKGVVITYGCLESFIDWMVSEHDLEGHANTFLNQAPFSFDLSVMDLYLSLVCGGTLFSITKEDINEPRQLYQSLSYSNVSIWVSTPSFARMCLIEPTFSERMLPNLRIFLFCGEILAPEVAAELLKRFPGAEVWNTYGPTETTVATTSVRIDQQTLADYSPLPVGYPKPDCRIYVFGSDGNQVSGGERGEIVIAGPNVSPGYVNRPELTRRAFFEIEGQPAYRTGDLGHFDDGLVFFDGRMDSQIKLHGYRIEIGDIEANLRICNNIQDVAVLPAAKDGLPDYLAAFVILNERQAGTDYDITRQVKKELSQRLPAYMVPRRFIFLSQFPMTANGKVDRRKLSERIA
ncbi:MAG: D-alanine--poly(phosphoribitol) ligase subunit DltA [Anaerolineaceae bacterium]